MPAYRTLRRPRTPWAISAALVALALLVAGCGGGQGHNGPVHSYVALGDSYTAGPGINPVTMLDCLRSGANYPSLVAKAEKLTSAFTDASCGGATTDNLLTTQKTNPPQLDAVTEKTDLVTIGIGLNNEGVSFKLLYLCLPTNGVLNPACKPALQYPTSYLTQALERITKEVGDSIDAVRGKAPNARIILIGYPDTMPASGTCSAIPLVPEAADRVRLALKTLNQLYAELAKSKQIDYIDTYDPTKGHDICSADPWFNGIFWKNGTGAPLHPRPAYHQMVAQKIEHLLRR